MRCTAGGPGKCADKPELNHCNCGASCYRDGPAAGSGYSCHNICQTDADCANFYDYPSTCKSFTADTGTAMKECAP